MQTDAPCRFAYLAVGLLSLATVAPGCKKQAEEKKAAEPAQEVTEKALKAPTPAELRTKASAMFGALPDQMPSPEHPITAPRVELGRMLYFDARLSKGQELSCNSCHDLTAYGVDARPEAVEKGTSFGHKATFGDRNSPTVYNAALHIAQFWDGRAKDVEEQAKGPILNPVEMAMPDDAGVLKVLKSIPAYKPAFAAAFPDDKDPITYDNVGSAIGAFERTLVTPAPFDAFVGGDEKALTAKQLAGLDAFISSGCMACHMGPAFGGSMFQKLGLVKPYETKDEGRAKVTGKEADKNVFKVPSLRNVAKTAPYFHDGSIKTLPEAVQIMAEHQTPSGPLSDQKVENIVAFLDSLTGELPKEKIAAPELPPSGPKTPKAVKD